ncbi:MAG: hypothetical protein V1682_00190, partial [Candidatus Omnitrophota bacterium]
PKSTLEAFLMVRQAYHEYFSSPWPKGNFARPQNCLLALEAFAVIGLRRGWGQARHPAVHEF